MALLSNRSTTGDIPGGPVVKTLPCNAGDVGSVPGRGESGGEGRWEGAKILHAMWDGQTRQNTTGSPQLLG